MSTRKLKTMAGVCLAAIAATSLIAEATVADAQGYNQGDPQGYGQVYNQAYNQGGGQSYNQGYGQGGQGYGQNGYPSDAAPPQGQYAPPPPGYEQGGAYEDQAQSADRDYAARYSAWAAQYCIDQRNNNTAAGAIIGGVLGAVVGAGVAGRGDRGAGAIIGGALGAGTGAAIGASSSSGAGCPPGYVIRAGAPAFYWGGPAVVTWAPAWYHPWVWVGGRWVYRPYRYWYWQHRAYWRPGWRAGAWRYHYDRW